MKIAKTNFSIDGFFFDKGQEVILDKKLLEGVSDLIIDSKDIEEVETKAMTTEDLKDKKLQKYKNK